LVAGLLEVLANRSDRVFDIAETLLFVAALGAGPQRLTRRRHGLQAASLVIRRHPV
jgi:hypothetical protein